MTKLMKFGVLSISIVAAAVVGGIAFYNQKIHAKTTDQVNLEKFHVPGARLYMAVWATLQVSQRGYRQSGDVKVEKLTIVTDAGTIVDSDSAYVQTRGAALWGMSMALYEGTELESGQVKDTNLDTYTLLRMGDMPKLDIELANSIEVPVGLGEPATTVVGPAIGNDIFAAVGARVHHLPTTPEAVRIAMTGAN